MLSTVIPANGTASGRSISNDYAKDGNPLKRATTDENGTVVTEIDLLGRTIKYTDVNSQLTTKSYDTLGRLASSTGPLGTETYTYDNHDRVTEQKLDGVVVAAPTYDQYGRVASVDYPMAGQQKLGVVSRDSIGRTTGYSYTLGDGTVVSDTVSRSQSGMVLSGSRVVGTNTLNSTYDYDKAGRLTSSTIGAHSYSYDFGAVDSSCGSGDSINPNAGKNSNRTKQTIDGITTTYCYDYADRLVSSSDQLVDAAEYDSHGNTTRLGSTSKPLRLQYDASDRNIALEEFDGSITGKGVYYKRDAGDRLIERKQDTITNGSHQTDSLVKYGYTDEGDTPDLLLDNAGNVKEKYLSMIGGVLLTIRPDATVETKKTTYSLPNVHGDMFVTTDKNGNITGNFDYDPFGNPLQSGAKPENTEAGSFDWVGRARKQTETVFALNVTQMGARVYLPTLGRFLQVDPVEGGTLNSYVYAQDPINQYDLNGKFLPLIAIGLIIARVAAVAIRVVPVVIAIVKAAPKVVPKVVQAAKAVVNVVKNVVRAPAKPSAPPAPRVVQTPPKPLPQPPLAAHGNSLSSTKPTWGYKLYSKEDGSFLKNGITSRAAPQQRYTKSFMEDKYMDARLFNNRLEAYQWEYEQNLILRGPLNKNMH